MEKGNEQLNAIPSDEVLKKLHSIFLKLQIGYLPSNPVLRAQQKRFIQQVKEEWEK